MDRTNPHIRICKRCKLPYDWRRSPSACMKMTYCGSLCERADLGFTIEGLVNDVVFLPRSAVLKRLLAA